MMTQVVQLLPCEHRSRDILTSAPLNHRGIRVKNEPEKWVLTDYLTITPSGLAWKKFHFYYVTPSGLARMSAKV